MKTINWVFRFCYANSHGTTHHKADETGSLASSADIPEVNAVSRLNADGGIDQSWSGAHARVVLAGVARIGFHQCCCVPNAPSQPPR